MSLYFTLRAILRMFKFIPDEFVVTFCGCWEKVNRPAGMLDEEHQADAARDDVSTANALCAKHILDKLSA